MRTFSWLLISLLFVACSGNEENHEENNDQNNSEEINQTTENSEIQSEVPKDVYQEFHPNGQLSIEGKLNENGNREGLWVSYYDNGTKWSESYYSDGIKEGHSLTFFPNGKVRYVGEYKADKKTGLWKFYDEEGNLSKEENF
ncbi:hypothetical protein K6119_14290 [Paracrocinitomix mangrovi]|uniref:toxin-antitoxin system YwqK family antitoxin n=1 Tax=Paracrocinitomix mangrovi TaxID=2862509 RepID=UPI001C8D1D03|nr:hypothetical protein [Paracrocinitomix mangrovi]UKN00901.1 hypothetical protein K6119_14290 [Paracrocinitomix mangrovi]